MTKGKKVNALTGGWMPAIVVSLLMFVLQGCTSMLPTYQTWQGGSKDRDQIAILHVPDDMRIYSVDGKPVSKGGLSVHSMSPRVSLLPGDHQVVFRYYSVWSLKGPAQANSGKLPDVVKSPLHQVTFNAKAGGSYHFDFKRPDSEDKAKQFAVSGFHPTLKDGQGSVVAQSEPYQASRTTPKQLAAQSAPAAVQSAQATSAPHPAVSATGAQAAPVPAAPDAGLSTLDAMKLLWQKASTEDKKAFLRWAFH